MAMSERPRPAISLDLDGVVFNRFPPIQIHALIGLAFHGNKIFWSLPTVPNVDRTVDEEGIKRLSERLSFLAHKRRKPMPDAKPFIAVHSENADIYGNTGRLAKGAWVGMTEESLRLAGVLPYFTDIFFKPEGVSSKASKAAAIAKLMDQYRGDNNITHIDDDPGTVLPLARMFPNVQFIILQDLTTGILFSRVEKNRYPNVKRVARLGDVT